MVIDPAVFPRLIKRTDTHLYLLPHPRLRAMVAHYTVSFPGTGPVPDTLTLIPDASGCIVSDWAPYTAGCGVPPPKRWWSPMM